jgi:preprotein translocase subunit SecG
LAYFLYGLFFVSCIVLIAAVLLQPGKTDAGALFTSNVSNTNYQPRGAQSVLARLTIIAATVFMLSALLLSLPALNGNVSVMETTGEIEPTIGTNANTADANIPVANEENSTSNTSGNIAEISNEANAAAENSNTVENKAEEKPAQEKPAEEKPAEEKPETK